MNKVIGKIAGAVACLMMAAVCCLPTLTHFAHAAETHAHSYENGRCACGSALFEAEDADLSGSMPSPGNTSNVGENAAASGGGLVNNWSVAGNEIVWTFSVDKSVTAPLELVMSPCEEATTFSSTLSLTVNGAAVAMADDDIRGLEGEQWHNYSAFVTQDVSFKKGDVRIVLKALRAYNVNIDCLRVDFAAADDVAVGAFNKLPTGEHTHVFGEGKCACGALIFEAEDAAADFDPAKDPSVEPTVGTNRAAHGGRFRGNWGDGSNKLTWTLDSEKAVTGATLDFVFAPCDQSGIYALPTDASQANGTITWPFEVRTEHTPTGGGAAVRQTVYWQTGTLAPMPTDPDNWHDYRVYASKPFDLAAGENKLVLEAYNEYPMNIDYIVVSPPASTDPVEPEHTHDFTDGVCACGATKLEAEDAAVSGTPSGGDSFLEASDKASGGWCIACWSEGDNLLKFSIDVDEACDNVPIGFVFAPCGGLSVHYTLPTTTEAADYADKAGAFWPFLLRVNGVGQGFTTADVPIYAGDDYYNWQTVYTNPVSLTAGKNTVEIEACDYYAMNLDYIFLEVKPDVKVTMPRTDNAEPTISAITATPDAPKAGDTVAFSFDVTDNATAADKIAVTVKVYLNYGKPTQSEIACADNKFTAAEAGKYTIVVTARDEAGLTAQKLRAVTVAAAETPAPDDPSSGDPGDGQEKGGCGSYVGGGLVSVAVLALAALVFGAVKLAARKKR